MTYLERVLAQPLGVLFAPLFLISFLNAVIIVELLRGSKIIAESARGDKKYLKTIIVVIMVIFPFQLGGLILARRGPVQKSKAEGANWILDLKKKAAHESAQFNGQ